jgi:phospholipid transport system substrate-binding protein
MKKISNLVTIFASIFLFSAPLAAGEPTAQLSATINEFVTILVNTPVAQLRASGLPQSALSLVFSRFDFSEMTKRSLGSHWESLGSAEQHEFVDAFTERVLRAYGRSVRASGDEKVQYARELRDGDLATVQTKVISGSGDELPIDYQLHNVGGQWKVYDVVIDQVSIVSNYRAQFDRILAKSSVKELLQKIKQQGS